MRRRLWIVPAALLFGVWLSIAYVNPYENTMSLSYLVMQLSGARGNFTMGLNMSELLAFTLRLVPTLVFQACAGISLYRHYCTASVYIFSRIPNRLRWYGREARALAVQALLYQGLILGAVIVTAVIRWEVVPLAAAGLSLADLVGVDLRLHHGDQPAGHLLGQQRRLCDPGRVSGGVCQPAHRPEAL